MSTLTKAKGAMAARLFLRGMWAARGPSALFVGFLAAWACLGWGAWMAMSWAGIGADWGAARTLVACAGASAELVLAACLPLAASIGDLDDHGHYGRAMLMDERGGGRLDSADERAWRIASCLAVAIVALDAGRLLAPMFAGAPAWLRASADLWWLIVDAAAALALGGFVGAAAAIGVGDIWRSSTILGPSGWCEAEREEIAWASSRPAGGSRRRKRL